MAQIITLDFETYYDSVYSLKKMTMEEYIRDPRFEVIGVSVKVGDQPPQTCTGGHARLRAFLRGFDWSNSVAVAHNALFDLAILSWRFGIVPKFSLCTMSMARWLFGVNESLSLRSVSEKLGLGQKGDEREAALGKRLSHFAPAELAAYMRYCGNDSDLCYGIFRKLYPSMPQQELQLLDWTIRAFTDPVLEVDGAVVRAELQRFLTKKNTLLGQLGVTQEDLRSDGKMAELLRALGVEPPTKLSPKKKNPDGTPATAYAFSKQDVEFVDLLEHEDENVALLAEARLATKTSLVESRLNRFIGISERGKLPVPLEFAGARNTRRWSGTDQINLQNLPRNPKGGKSPLRQAIRAPDGMLLWATDLSQIELRHNAWQSGQRDILELIRAGQDVYSHMATRVFGFDVNKNEHPSERFVGKTAELGCGYQCGAPKFHHMLSVDSRKYNIKLADPSLAFAENVVKTYRQTHKAVVAFWYAARDAIPHLAAGTTYQLGPYTIRNGRVELFDGVYLYYPNLRQRISPDDGQVEWVYDRVKDFRKETHRIYGGKLVENITQAVSALYMKRAMLRLQRRFRVVGTVHDEVLFVTPENVDTGEVSDWVRECMTTPPLWAVDIPLDCETHWGHNYADVK